MHVQSDVVSVRFSKQQCFSLSLSSDTEHSTVGTSGWRPIAHSQCQNSFRNKPYLPDLGEDLKCLDVFTFVRSRFQKNTAVPQESCSQDPFLCAITPHGIPIEPTSSFMVRQGGRLDQKGLRLRSAVRIVEPRITSASMISRVNPAPGQLPPLHARGRSSTRKTSTGPKKRAATHRDSTCTQSCSDKAAQPAGPEQLHLPSLMREDKPSHGPEEPRHPFTTERPAGSGKSASATADSQQPRRSMCSEPPSRGGGNTCDSSSASSKTDCPNSQQASAQQHGASLQLGRAIAPSVQFATSSQEAPVDTSTAATLCAAAEPFSHTGADGGAREDRAEEQPVALSSHVELEEVGRLCSGEHVSLQDACSQVC